MKTKAEEINKDIAQLKIRVVQGLEKEDLLIALADLQNSVSEKIGRL